MSNLEKAPAHPLALPPGSRATAWLPTAAATREQVQVIHAAASSDLFASLRMSQAGPLVNAALTRAIHRLGHKNQLLSADELNALTADVLQRIRTYYPRLTVPELELILSRGIVGDLAPEKEYHGLSYVNICLWLRVYHDQVKPLALGAAVPPEPATQAPTFCELPPDHPVYYYQLARRLASFRQAPKNAPLFYLPLFVRLHHEMLTRIGVLDPDDFTRLFSEQALAQYQLIPTQQFSAHVAFKRAVFETGEAPLENYYTQRAMEASQEAQLRAYLSERSPQDIFDEVRIGTLEYFALHPYTPPTDGL